MVENIKNIIVWIVTAIIFLAVIFIIVYSLPPIIQGGALVFHYIQSGLGLIPFGISGLIFGSIIILFTYFSSKEFFTVNGNVGFSWSYISQLNYFESTGYLFGLTVIISSVIWFFLPSEIYQVLPSFTIFLIYSLLVFFALYGVGEAFTEFVSSLLRFQIKSIGYAIVVIAGFWFMNYPLWYYTETLPVNLYFGGKIFLASMFFLQILYVIFFYLISAQLNYKDKETLE